MIKSNTTIAVLMGLFVLRGIALASCIFSIQDDEYLGSAGWFFAILFFSGVSSRIERRYEEQKKG